MANTNSPFGFKSFGHQDGSAPTMGLQRYFINSSDANLYFTGDPVALSSAVAGVLSPYNGSSVGPRLVGVFAGCEFYSPTVARQVWSPFFPGSVSSSSPVTAYVISDPEMQFLVQASSAGITATSVGLNVNVLTSLSSLGNQSTGISAVTITSSQLSASSSLPFTIIDVYSNFGPPGQSGTDNSSAYNIVVVTPNNTMRHAGVTGVTT